MARIFLSCRQLAVFWLFSAVASLVQASAPPTLPGLQAVRSIEGIEEYALPNGLRVLLARDDSKPSTTVNLTLKVGSRHENYGETGMAHLLEHLLFKGSAKHPQPWGEFTKRGLRANGSTWLDRTNYFASFAASDDNLRWYLGWLSDAMVNSFIARKDLDSEMTVVRNEMEMGENSPERILMDKTLATMYTWHNYGKSTIGARTDVEQVDIGRLQAFYKTWYRPDNATLIVSGRFDPKLTARWISLAFGAIPKPKSVMPRLYTLDPTQDGEREVVLRRAGGAGALIAAYHSVPGAHRDHAGAELLALVMGDVPAGRLHRRLTEQRLAANTWSWTPALHDPGLIVFGADLNPGQDTQASAQALLETLEGTRHQPITQDELERARRRWLKGWDQIYNDPEQLGVALSESVAQGDWRLLFLLRDRVRDFNLADLQRFANERLLPSNRTLGRFVPTDKADRAPAPAMVSVDQQLAQFQPKSSSVQLQAFDPAPMAIEGRLLKSARQGMRVVQLAKETRGQVVTITLRLHVGSVDSLRGQGQVPTLWASLLDKGTQTLGRQAIQDRLDQARAEMAFSYRLGVLQILVQARRDSVADVTELLADMLRHPRFDAQVFDEVRRQALASLEQARKEPDAIVANALERHGNPYASGDSRQGNTFEQIESDLRSVTLEQVQAFHRQLAGSEQMEWSVVGDHDPQAWKRVMEKAFAGWETAQRVARVAQPLWNGPPARLEFKTPDKQNATMMVRLAMEVAEGSDDQAALMLANFIFGQSGSSRLWMRIREQAGLSYDVRSTVQWNPMEKASVWHASAIFAPENLKAVETAFSEEVDRAIRNGFTAMEVKEGKIGLLNFRRLQRAQDPVLSGGLARQLEFGRTMEHEYRLEERIRSLSPEAVHAAFKRYIKPELFVKAVAGDFKDR